jgi:hypothetical protein
VQDSSVSIVTRYGLDGPGIESRWGARFSTPIQTNSVKRLGRGVLHPPPFNTEVKETAELYLYSPLGLCGLLQGELYLCYLYDMFSDVIKGT